MDEIQGSVHLTQNITLGPFENATISGLLKGPVQSSSYYKHVNVSVEPLEVHKEDGAKYCAVPGYMFLKPGLHRIHVMIKNLTVRNITVNQGSKIAKMAAANVIPHMLAPQTSTQTETLPAKNAQCSTIKGGERCSNVEEPPRGSPSKKEKEVDRTPLPPDKMEKLFEQIKLKEGTSHWTEDQQKRVRSVIEKYSFLFAMDSLDLGQMDMVKHHIDLTDYTPIKDRYQRIPHISMRRCESI